jgi:pimeloyl-ACP methyl ester carboxylesterase
MWFRFCRRLPSSSRPDGLGYNANAVVVFETLGVGMSLEIGSATGSASPATSATNGPATTGAATIVFVHGGQHTGACWQPTVNAISAANPAIATISVDLPGRRKEPGDLATLTIDQCARSVIRQIDEAGAARVMLVGHSMAGLCLPSIATLLGAGRVSRMVYLACCVPPQGKTVMSTLKPPVSWFAEILGRFQKVSKPMPGPIAKWMFANGMTESQKAQVVAGLVSESAAITREAVDRSAMPDIDTTWIITKQDNSLKPALQREFIANLGNVDEAVEIDTCHNAMMSEPVQLATMLLARHR